MTGNLTASWVTEIDRLAAKIEYAYHSRLINSPEEVISPLVLFESLQ